MATEVAFEDRLMSVEGVTARVLIGGEGPNLVYLHGVGYEGKWPTPALDHLAPHFRIYAPDMPGFGLSALPDSIRSCQDLAVWLDDFTAESGLEKLSLMGHSFGGWVALEFAVLFQHKLQKLVLVDALGVNPGLMTFPDIFNVYPQESLGLIFHDQELGKRLLGVEAGERGFSLAGQTIGSASISDKGRDRRSLSVMAWSPLLYNPKLPSQLRRIKVPTLVVWGKQDKLTPIRIGRYLQRKLKNARLAVIEGCGHAPTMEKPEMLAKIVAEYLKG